MKKRRRNNKLETYVVEAPEESFSVFAVIVHFLQCQFTRLAQAYHQGGWQRTTADTTLLTVSTTEPEQQNQNNRTRTTEPEQQNQNNEIKTTNPKQLLILSEFNRLSYAHKLC
jgi:hypothetical protein